MTRNLRMRWSRGCLAALAALMACAAVDSHAQSSAASWPSRAVKIIVPQAPGGGTDALARILGERLQATLGQPFIIENRVGAGGNIGTEFVARADPDGSTLLLTTNTHVTNVSFFAKLPYDPITDFAPVSLIASIPFVMAVNSITPYQSVKDLIKAGRDSSSNLTYASGGPGTPHHLATELFKSMTGVQMTHVPYKGSSTAVVALVSNEVTVSISAVNSMLPFIRNGKLRPLGVASAQRTPLLPGVPTIAEAAGLPGYEVDIWYGILAPAKTPPDLVERINAEVNKILNDPQLVKDKLVPQGLDPKGTTPAKFAETIKSDLVKYQKVARDANIRPE